MEKLFFELIRVAIGRQESLSSIPSDKEWEGLYDLAKKHCIVGICYAGISVLRGRNPEICQMLEKSLRLRWLSQATRIQERNSMMNSQCVLLQNRLAKDGFSTSILKGQGIATYYGELAMYRQCGDIDIWVDATMDEVMAYVEKLGGRRFRFDIKNVVVPTQNGVEVELHWCAEMLMNLCKSNKLQKFWNSNRDEMIACKQTLPGNVGEVIIPSIAMNRFYVLLHCYRHLFTAGIGLRQIMDYYYVMLQNCDVKDTKDLVDSFGMKRFAQAVMWIMGEVFGLERDKMYCEPNEREGRFLLNEIMETGNFGHHDSRIKNIGTSNRQRFFSHVLQHNLHIIAHYPQETLWAPVWLAYHYIWKRMWLFKNK